MSVAHHHPSLDSFCLLQIDEFEILAESPPPTSKSTARIAFPARRSGSIPPAESPEAQLRSRNISQPSSHEGQSLAIDPFVPGRSSTTPRVRRSSFSAKPEDSLRLGSCSPGLDAEEGRPPSSALLELSLSKGAGHDDLSCCCASDAAKTQGAAFDDNSDVQQRQLSGLQRLLHICGQDVSRMWGSFSCLAG